MNDDIIEQCAQIAETEPEAGDPTSAQLAQLEMAGVVAVGNAAIAATKRSIAARIRALKGKQ